MKATEILDLFKDPINIYTDQIGTWTLLTKDDRVIFIFGDKIEIKSANEHFEPDEISYLLAKGIFSAVAFFRGERYFINCSVDEFEIIGKLMFDIISTIKNHIGSV